MSSSASSWEVCGELFGVLRFGEFLGGLRGVLRSCSVSFLSSFDGHGPRAPGPGLRARARAPGPGTRAPGPGPGAPGPGPRAPGPGPGPPWSFAEFS